MENFKKKKMKKMVIGLLVTFLMLSITGCGIVQTSYRNSDDPKQIYIDSTCQIPITNTTLSMNGNLNTHNVEDKRLDSVTRDGNLDADKQGFWTIQLNPIDAKEKYRFNPNLTGIVLFRDVAVFMYESVFSEDWGNDDFCYGNTTGLTLDPVKLIKTVNTATIDAMKNNNTLNSITSSIEGLAIAMLMAIWTIGFISQIVNEKFSMETLLKTLMQLICGILLVKNAENIVSAFAGAGNWLVSKINAHDALSLSTQYATFYNKITEQLGSVLAINVGFNIADFIILPIVTIWFDFNAIIVILFLFFPFLQALICAYKIISIMIIRMLELIVRISLAPIPLALSAQNGFSQESIRYFRSVMACALQPVVMIIGASCMSTITDMIMKIFNNASSADLNEFTASIAIGLSFMILSAFLGQTQQLSKEIIAH